MNWPYGHILYLAFINFVFLYVICRKAYTSCLLSSILIIFLYFSLLYPICTQLNYLGFQDIHCRENFIFPFKGTQTPQRRVVNYCFTGSGSSSAKQTKIIRIRVRIRP